MGKEGLKTVIFVILILGVAFLSYSIGAISNGEAYSLKSVRSDEPTLALVEDTLGLLRTSYAYEINDYGELIYGAVEGIIQKLRGEPYNDLHSAFLEPTLWENLSVATRGTYTGVGIVIGIDPEKRVPVITSVFPGSPAGKSGLTARDLIVAVDGIPTLDMQLDEVASTIMGEEGTKVTLSILREGWEEPKDFVLTRARVEVRSVTDIKMVDEGVGYFRINTFGERTEQEVREAVDELVSMGARSLILDLRNNPGGLFESAVRIADMFLSAGKIVTIEQKGKEPETYYADEDPDDISIPLVVMVNRYSASAAEILSAALKDNNRAVLVGNRTYGKASVQEVFPLQNGKVALSLTVGRYLTPKGQDLSREPLEPDIKADLENLQKVDARIKKKSDELAKKAEEQALLYNELVSLIDEVQLEVATKIAENPTASARIGDDAGIAQAQGGG